MTYNKSNTQAYINGEWMDIVYVPVEDQDGQKLGTAEAYISEWMDDTDQIIAYAEAVTLWASDYGYCVDSLFW